MTSIEMQAPVAYSDVPGNIDINLPSSHYEPSEDTIHADNRLFEEEDAGSEDNMEGDVQEGDIQEAGTSHGTGILDRTGVGNVSFHEAPSRSFTEIDWEAANVCTSSALHVQSVTWERGEELCKGLQFADKAELQNAVKQYSIDRHHEFKVVESGPCVWVVKCKNRESGCNWMLRAIKRHEYFEVTRYRGPHSCISAMLSQDHSGLDSNLIANEIRDLVKEVPTISIAGISAVLKNRFNYTPSYRKMWEAKQKAMAMVFGDWDKSYDLMPKWLRVVQEFNPGTWLKFISNPTGHPSFSAFDRVFWAFGPSIEGFKHCRPVISIDATFLYGKYQEKLMIATGIDGNNQIFPIAFAIVDEESTDTWGWFLACLKCCLRSCQELCLISDRHPGILSAIQNEHLGWQPPNAYHVFCLRHVASNFNTRFRNSKLRDLVKKTGMQVQVRKFNKYMKRIEKVNAEAIQWLNEIPVEKWTLAHDGGRRFGTMTTNLSECFNGVLKHARFLPVTSMVQLTFFRLVSYFDGRRAQADEALNRGERFTPFATTRIIANQSKAGAHNVTSFDRASGIFQIQTAMHGPHFNRGNNIQVKKKV